jgi:hypothetical protein
MAQVHKSLSHYNDRSTDFYASSYQDNFCKFAPGQNQPGAPEPYQYPPTGIAKVRGGGGCTAVYSCVQLLKVACSAVNP